MLLSQPCDAICYEIISPDRVYDLTGIAACQTIQQMTALQNVDFALYGVREVRLAGVRLDNVRSASDLGISGTTRILAAYAAGELPLSPC